MNKITSTEDHLKWFCGFFDGKGSLSIDKDNIPSIYLNNEDPKVTMFSKYILNKYDVEVKVSERSRPSKSSKKSRWDLYISDRKNCIKTAAIMSGHSIVKKNQFDVILKLEHKKSGISDKMNFEKAKNYYPIGSDSKEISTNDFNDKLWFIGMFDALYEIGVEHRQSKDRDRDEIKPYLKIEHTNKFLIEQVCSYLKNNKISYHIKCIDGKERLKWHVLTSGIFRVKNFIENIREYSILKQEALDTMYFFIMDVIIGKKSNDDFKYSFKKTIDSISKR